MKLVVDASAARSALIADAKTRERLVTLEPNLLAPEVVYDAIENDTELFAERAGMSPDRVERFIDLLFSS